MKIMQLLQKVSAVYIITFYKPTSHLTTRKRRWRRNILRSAFFFCPKGLSYSNRSTVHLLIKPNSRNVFHTKSLSCIKSKENITMKMKTTAPNPLFAKIRLFLIVLTSCVIATCIFLIIIHPEVWMIPACGIIIALCILLYEVYCIRKNRKRI